MPVNVFSTAFLGHFDFIYALPNAWLSVPFAFLGKRKPDLQVAIS